MATNLYEILGLDKNAAPEDIRKAYRRRALQTHPDRLPPNMSATEKAAAEEQFRLVNHAYEVLNNEQNRILYDRFGVWPPPTEPEPQRSYSQGAFGPQAPEPFFGSPFGSGSRRPYAFTDPFVLFNSLFGDIHNNFPNDDPFISHPFSTRSPFDHMGDPFGRSVMSPFGGSLFGQRPSTMLGQGSTFSELMGSGSRSYSSVTRAVGRNGQWVSESKMTRMINGRKETITKRRDAQGNEHITYSSPEGERYTINGIEQPLQNGRAIASAPPPPAQQQSQEPQQAISSLSGSPASNYVPPSSSYYAPFPPQPQAQPKSQARAKPQAHQTYIPAPPALGSHHSSASSRYAYPTQPAPPVEPVPVPQQHLYDDPRASTHGHKRSSSHAHGGYNGLSSETSSAHSEREHDRKRLHRERSHASSPSEGDHSRRDSHRERARDPGPEQDKKWWRGGW